MSAGVVSLIVARLVPPKDLDSRTRRTSKAIRTDRK